jgi:hypothetical protein
LFLSSLVWYLSVCLIIPPEGSINRIRVFVEKIRRNQKQLVAT